MEIDVKQHTEVHPLINGVSMIETRKIKLYTEITIFSYEGSMLQNTIKLTDTGMEYRTFYESDIK